MQEQTEGLQARVICCKEESQNLKKYQFENHSISTHNATSPIKSFKFQTKINGHNYL